MLYIKEWKWIKLVFIHWIEQTYRWIYLNIFLSYPSKWRKVLLGAIQSPPCTKRENKCFLKLLKMACNQGRLSLFLELLTCAQSCDDLHWRTTIIKDKAYFFKSDTVHNIQKDVIQFFISHTQRFHNTRQSPPPRVDTHNHHMWTQQKVR